MTILTVKNEDVMDWKSTSFQGGGSFGGTVALKQGNLQFELYGCSPSACMGFFWVLHYPQSKTMTDSNL